MSAVLSKQVRSQIASANKHFETAAEPAPAPPAAPAPALAAVPPPAPPAPPVAVLPPNYETDMEHLRTLRGMHKAREAETVALRTKVAELSAQIDQFKAAATAPRSITEAEIKEYTPELLDVIARKAQEQVAPMLSGLNTELAQLRQRNAQLETMLSGVASSTDKVQIKSFLDEIAELMPNFVTVNDDPQFMQWLNTIDPLSGEPYRVNFYKARDDKSAQRIVRFFQTYAALHPAASPAAAPAAPAAPPLASMVVPEPGANPSAAPQKATKIWTQAQITAFYKDKSQGRWALTPEVAKALEADLFKAQAEGRVAA